VARQRGPRYDLGFTLVELIVTVVIFGVVGTIVGSSLIQGLQTSRRVQARAEANQMATLALERLARHARAAAVLLDATPTTLRLESVSNGVCRQYAYAYAQATGEMSEQVAPCTETTGTGLTTVPGTTTRVLLRGLRNDPAAAPAAPVFVARDRFGAVSSASHAVSVDLLAVVQPPEGTSFQLRSSVTLRNQK
jgi:prepilin-type N-terminal cleavage/methylation domain-containing protein